MKQVKVGWLIAGAYPWPYARWRWLGAYRWFYRLGPSNRMRVGNNAAWMNRYCKSIHNEMYDSRRHYDVVVVHKATECYEEAQRIQRDGGKIVFGVNVNYYEIWGEYDVAGTRPTERQQSGTIAMTELADMVVADSTYLSTVARRFNPRTVTITDNVNLQIYRAQERPRRSSLARTRLVWSGMSMKAQHLTMILPVLLELKDKIELVLVSDQLPDVAKDISSDLVVQYIPFSDRRYADVLRTCDVIVSPKRLINAYEMGHTEHKITLGMAMGLPAVASPQPSYIEAISDRGGGFIATTLDEWRTALSALIDNPALRLELGEKAKQTVAERYATERTARQYAELVMQLGGRAQACK